MVYLSYSKQDLFEHQDLINSIKTELNNLNIEYTDEPIDFKSNEIQKILVLHSNNYLQDPLKKQEYQLIKENLNSLKVIEVNLDDSISQLQNSGFSYWKHRNLNDTIAIINKSIVDDYDASFIKTKITQNHNFDNDSSQEISLSFQVKSNISEMIFYLIFQGHLVNEPEITKLLINDEPATDFVSIYDEIEMEYERKRMGLRVYLNQDVKQNDWVKVSFNLNNENVEGFYLWIEDLRKTQVIDGDAEFEKIYYNLQFRKIAEM